MASEEKDERKGYTAMAQDGTGDGESAKTYALVSESDTTLETANGLGQPEIGRTDSTLLRQRSAMKESQEEFERLKDRGEHDSIEYANIVKNAAVSEDVPNDCWGALIFIVVNDLPEWRAGRASKEVKIRIVFCTLVFVGNLAIQGILLFFIGKLLMMPGMLSAQDLYRTFHEQAFADGVFEPDRFTDMDTKSTLCGLALSQRLFVRVILFLWVTTNVGECRDNFAMMIGACNLPRLPLGLDTRLMVRDLPQTEAREYSVVCLNMIGKVTLVIVVFIPKFLIAFVLTCSGCLWLMAAENTGDLILNSLALAFVCKVDELIAAVFFPVEFQVALANLAFYLPADPDADDDDIQMEKRFLEFVECAVILLSAIAFVEILILYQPVIPSYDNDVTNTCMGYINSQVPWCLPWQGDCFPKR